MRAILFILLSMQSILVMGQINWKVADDSLELTPNVFSDSGSIKIVKGKMGGFQEILIVNGIVSLFVKEKKLIIKYDDNSNLIKPEHVDDIELIHLGRFTSDELFKSKFIDTLLTWHRKDLFKKLDLNEITFSYSKRVEYEMRDGKLELKNQKIQKGKICSISPYQITILTESGDLLKFEDGDFNYLTIGGQREYSCNAVYSKFYKNYLLRQKDNISNWEDYIKKSSIETLINQLGAFSKLVQLSADRKVITWEKINISYSFRMFTNSLNLTTRNSSYSASDFSTGILNLNTYSPIFLNAYSSRVSQFSGNVDGNEISSNSTRQSGSISSHDEGYQITVIVDGNNKILSVYNENIFSSPRYGISFSFIRV